MTTAEKSTIHNAAHFKQTNGIPFVHQIFGTYRSQPSFHFLSYYVYFLLLHSLAKRSTAKSRPFPTSFDRFKYKHTSVLYIKMHIAIIPFCNHQFPPSPRILTYTSCVMRTFDVFMIHREWI